MNIYDYWCYYFEININLRFKCIFCTGIYWIDINFNQKINICDEWLFNTKNMENKTLNTNTLFTPVAVCLTTLEVISSFSSLLVVFIMIKQRLCINKWYIPNVSFILVLKLLTTFQTCLVVLPICPWFEVIVANFKLQSVLYWAVN